jgi:tetratricopeptide (TPR) repeat protein
MMWPALLAATLLAYRPAWSGGLLWDDDHHLTRAGLRSLDGLWRIWFDLGATQQYYPITHTAFWLQSQLWGDSTLGYHLVNITLHVAAAGLVWMILHRLRIPGAALAATIFALHPVNVESVAWISELKNTLSAVAYLGAALAYLYFDERRTRAMYVAALVLFLAAVLAKSVTATLPAALLVIFWWQRGRIDLARDLKPLAPFFAIGLGLGAMTAWIERTLIGAQGSDYQFTLVERALIAGRALWFYVATLAWPSNLTFIYPRWTIDASDATLYLYLAAVIAVAAAAWVIRGRTRAPLAALLFFVGTLAPALGFVNVYPFRFSFVADHFQYLAALGPIVLVSAGMVSLISLVARSRVPSWAVEAAAVAVVAWPLGLMTWQQARQYVDADSLYRATIARNPECWLAYNNLGALQLDSSNASVLADAVANLRTAVRLNPDFPEAHNNLGNGLARQRQPLLAMTEYREALRLRPAYPEAHSNLGNVLHQIGQVGDAMAQHREALELDPDSADAHNDLGIDLQAAGNYDAAVAEHTEAVRLDPASAAARNARGSAFEGLHRPLDAMADYHEALRLDPSFAAAHRNLGVALAATGRVDEAITELKEAMRLDPAAPEAHDDLGHLFLQIGLRDAAIQSFQDALSLAPDYGPAHFHLGNVLQKAGRLDDAVKEYQAALKYDDSADVRHNLGIAFVRLGKLGDAATHFEQALKLNPADDSSRDALQRVRAMIKKADG